MKSIFGQTGKLGSISNPITDIGNHKLKETLDKQYSLVILNKIQKNKEFTFYLPADFSIQFKSLGEFDFSTLRCEVEALIRIKIFCARFLELLDKFLLQTTIIWEDGTVEKLTQENCILAEKDVHEGQVKFIFSRKITTKIQAKMFCSPIEQINMYTSLQIQNISYYKTKKQLFNLRVNFPDFSKQIKQKRNIKLISVLADIKQQVLRSKLNKSRTLKENHSIQKLKDNTQKQSKQSNKSENQKGIPNNFDLVNKVNNDIKNANASGVNALQKKNYKTYDLSFQRYFKNNYYLPAVNQYEIISAFEDYEDEYQKQNINSKIKFKRENAQIAYKSQNGQAQYLSFNQIRMKIKVYKQPIQTLLAIMLPVGLLSFINCAIFFQPPSLEDRVGSIASILIAYGTTVLQIRNQIAKATDWTLMEIVLYLQTICCILTLVHGMRTMYYDKEYQIDWTSNQLFLTVFSASILCCLVFIVLAIKYCVWNLPKYKSQQRELYGVQWLQHVWNGDCEDNSEKNHKSALDTQGQLYRGTSESDLI